VGLSYRSAIFYTSDEQKWVAEDTIADVEASGLWPGKVVTEVSPVGPFWEAEPEHQDYLEKIPNGYSCHFNRPHWKLRVRKDAGGLRRAPQSSAALAVDQAPLRAASIGFAIGSWVTLRGAIGRSVSLGQRRSRPPSLSSSQNQAAKKPILFVQQATAQMGIASKPD
jgi:hypothetical protein